jgi:hypothetical protein
MIAVAGPGAILKPYRPMVSAAPAMLQRWASMSNRANANLNLIIRLLLQKANLAGVDR